MPRYFFDLHDGQDLLDHEGRELPDLKAAQTHAAEMVSLQLKEDARLGATAQPWTLDVKDEQQHVLFTLKFETLKPT